MSLIGLIVSLVTNLAYAEGPVHYLKKDEKAPYTGYLFTPPLEQEVRLLDEKNNLCQSKIQLYQKMSATQNDVLDLTNKRLELYKKQTDALALEYRESEESSFWKSTLFFVLGAALTGGIGYAVYKTR